MKKLKEFHDMNLQVKHTFDIFGQIDFYESLWDGTPSIYRDYKRTKDHVFSLKEIIEKHKDNERIMIVAHGAINKALMRYVRKNEIKDFWMGSLQRNCGVTIVEFKDGKFNILEENTVFYDYKKNK